MVSMKVPLKNPRPDIEEFRDIILRKKGIKNRVHFCELHIDKEIIKEVTLKFLNRRWVEPEKDNLKTREEYLKNYIECWYRLGYDYIRFTTDFRFEAGLSFKTKSREGNDTSQVPKPTRKWTEEGKGVIISWEDFERYPWPEVEDMDLWSYEFASDNLPEGMGIMGCLSGGILEIALNDLFGYETLSYLIYDDPELVRAVFDRIGNLVYKAYERLIGLKNLVGFFQGDDMGFKTATLISPEALRRYVLPWHKKLAEFCHSHNLLYILHSCGNLEAIMEELIHNVKIDARHSFEDAIMPVTEVKKKYGDRIAILGGVDVDKLCRFKEKDLRAYVRNILDICMPGGAYALGTGNSVANYIPLNNYLIMLDEGLKYLQT